MPTGGLRWWLACPRCGHRRARLYLPPGGQTFACRACHGLAYLSSRESRKWDGIYRALAAAMETTPDRVRGVLEAGERLRRREEARERQLARRRESRRRARDVGGEP